MELNPRDCLDPTDAIGSTYLHLRRWNEAEYWRKLALALDPHHINAAYHLDLTYVGSTGDIQSAGQAWEGVPDDKADNNC